MKKVLIILAAAVVAALLFFICANVTGMGQNNASAPMVTPTSEAPPSKVVSTSRPPTKAKTPAPKPSPVPATIQEGIWLVGTDIKAGTYRTNESVTGQDCYWMKASDAEGSNIIDNAIPSGGRPQVTLKKGQWFTTTRCGEWTAVK